MWEFLRMRLGRPVGVVSITSSAARSTETVNGGGVPRLVVSLLRLGSNRVPVRLLSSQYILLSVGRCRALSDTVGRCRYVSGAPRLGGLEVWRSGGLRLGFLAQGAVGEALRLEGRRSGWVFIAQGLS